MKEPRPSTAGEEGIARWLECTKSCELFCHNKSQLQRTLNAAASALRRDGRFLLLALMRTPHLATSSEAESSTAGSRLSSAESTTPPRSPLCGSDDKDIFASDPIAQHMAMYMPNSPLIAQCMQDVVIPKESFATTALYEEYCVELEAKRMAEMELDVLYDLDGFSRPRGGAVNAVGSTMAAEPIDIPPSPEPTKQKGPVLATPVVYLTSMFVSFSCVPMVSYMTITAKNAPKRQVRLGEPGTTPPPTNSRKLAPVDGQPKRKRGRHKSAAVIVSEDERIASSVTHINAEPDELNIRSSPKKSKSKKTSTTYIFACTACPDSRPSRSKSDVVAHLQTKECGGLVQKYASEGQFVCAFCDLEADATEIPKHERFCQGKLNLPNDSTVNLPRLEHESSAVVPSAVPRGVPEETGPAKGMHYLACVGVD